MLLQIESFGTSALQTFGAFGFLVVFMFIVIWKLYAELITARKRNDELSDKTMELMTRLSDRIPGLEQIQDMKRNQTDILSKSHEVISIIKDALLRLGK